MFLILADFLSTLEGGREVWTGRDLFTAGRAGTARKVEWVRRADRYSRQFLSTRPGRPVQEGKKSGSAGGLSRMDRYSRQLLSTHPGRPVRQGKQGGPVQEGSGQVGMEGGGVALPSLPADHITTDN